ncbi:SDR family NAD(P)-dependent oxidoreductase [Aquincola sp. S2]|uniref:SDR family NAD(P)-dependent oxidoreductase n=1 Tax=Pseudaquabacterium terrae TaxID=2732868 RepID=A0ABX2EBE0_9BURK|nr:SDR family NAD(P)-dependent oxidoreductase [Aquabacterium terrae]NRF65729.1 SDR family NAD(P)-dependent oxidoreductase [Aquabacterium terrae]
MQSAFSGRSAIVTGAASGIGLGLARALAARGAKLWLVDIDAAGLERAAQALGSACQAATLDVRDAPALQALIERVAREHGRLDYVFNNAGIGIGGEASELGVAHYDRSIDVNIRGVVNGTVAAYGVMVRQRSGHIVNTASLAGLTPVPLLVPYAMTKHAVVGLSTSLRAEAALHGVRVSALCPAAVETPLLDSSNPADLPPLRWRADVRHYLERLSGPPYPADRTAEDTLRGVERNQALIIVPGRARFTAVLNRWLPGVVRWATQQALREEMKRGGR